MKSVRRPLVAVSTMLVFILLQAVADPTGLLALVGWSGALPSASLWSWAPYLVFVPVLLIMLWWVALRAGARFWTLAAGITLSVLLAQAVTALSMTWNFAAAGHAAGFVAAKAVPAALIVAAFTRWLGGPGVRTKFAPGSVVPAAVLLAALAPLLSGLWWTGAQYAPGIPVPRAESGAASAIMSIAAIALLAVPCLRWTRTRISGVLGGWIAALVAGGTFGLVQAAVGFFVDRGPGGDIWPLMATYLAVADGLAFGACTGWLVGLAAVATDRMHARRTGASARVPELVAASFAVIALSTTLLSPLGEPATAVPAATPPAGFLRTEGTKLADGKGNQVLLRGVNVNQLVDFHAPRPEVPATRELTEADYAGMAAQGFNVARLNISWSLLEPVRGTLDPAYLARIDEAVAWAKKHGIYTVLDMHQDGWWNGPTEEGTTCRPGTEPMWGYDGAPEWATITDGAPRCQFTGRDISPAGNRAFQNFYFDTGQVRTALAQTWGELAGRYRDEPMVAGFDLLNEPGFGETAPVTTSHLLAAFYGEAIKEIRKAGAEQIVFIEPSIFWSGLGFDTGPAPGFSSDANIAFSPHLYAESITMDRDLGLPAFVSLERQFELATRVAKQYDAPVWSGEYGYWGADAEVLDRLQRFAVAEDKHLLGSAYWVWKQACGDPQNGIGPVGEALMMQDCATGLDAPPKSALLEVLSRAYPRSAPGTLGSLNAQGSDFSFTGSSSAPGCGLQVWVPGTGKPALDSRGVTSLKSVKVPGGWLVGGCVDGDYSVSSRP